MTQLTDKKYLERWANMYTLAHSTPNDDRFNMSFWAHANESTVCGTSACMAGHASLHPWFRRRGFKPKFGGGVMELNDGILESFWGADTEDNHFIYILPFEPSDCRRLAGLDYGIKIIPKRGAKAVKTWMLKFWSKEQVKAAIGRATATYDAKWVHKYTPWECPTRA